MEKGDIRIKKAVMHILDPLTAGEILSNKELEIGPGLDRYLKMHIAKVMKADTRQEGSFDEENSEFLRILENYTEECFMDASRKMAEMLYGIMCRNIIPPADLIVARFAYGGGEYIAVLKMDYKEGPIHLVVPDEEAGYRIEMATHKNILPAGGQGMAEAAVIRLEDKKVWLTEKKREVDGLKVAYFSQMFLQCRIKPSRKQKLAKIERTAVSTIEDSAGSEKEKYRWVMGLKDALDLMSCGKDGITVEGIARYFSRQHMGADQIFAERAKMAGIEGSIQPEGEKAVKHYRMQELHTGEGIEIRIPMEVYREGRTVQITENGDGTADVLIRGIAFLEAKL